MGEVSGEAAIVAREAQRRTDPVELVQRCAHRGLTLATAESLTAGSLASRVADVPGASAVLLGGVVAYCNEVKESLLDVDPGVLESKGAVDPGVAAAMARGAAKRIGTELGVSTTGVAGPEPHQGKDVGTVYLGLAIRQGKVGRLSLSLPKGCEDAGVEGWLSGSLLLNLDGDRSAIRNATVEEALHVVEECLLTEPPGFLPAR